MDMPPDRNSPAPSDQDAMITIREYLQTNGGPSRPAVHKVTRTSTKKSAGSGSQVSDIYEWDDFALPNINRLFGAVLDERVFRSRLPSLPDLPREQLQVWDEDSFEAVAIADTARILNTALVVGSEVWNSLHPSESPIHPVLMLKGGYAKYITKCKPDWSGIRRRKRDGDEDGDRDGDGDGDRDDDEDGDRDGDLDERPESLVCGESKYADKGLKVIWKDGQEGRVDSSIPNHANIMSWLNQANEYAALHDTRFFYVLMPMSAFICRRFADEPLSNARSPQTPRKTIPQKRSYAESPASQEPSTPESKAVEDDLYEVTPAGRVGKLSDVNIHLANVTWHARLETKAREIEEVLSVNLALWTVYMLATVRATRTLPLSEYGVDDLQSGNKG